MSKISAIQLEMINKYTTLYDRLVLLFPFNKIRTIHQTYGGVHISLIKFSGQRYYRVAIPAGDTYDRYYLNAHSLFEVDSYYNTKWPIWRINWDDISIIETPVIDIIESLSQIMQAMCISMQLYQSKSVR